MISKSLYKNREMKDLSATDVPNVSTLTSTQIGSTRPRFKRRLSGEIESEKVTIPRKMDAQPLLFRKVWLPQDSTWTGRWRREALRADTRPDIGRGAFEHSPRAALLRSYQGRLSAARGADSGGRGSTAAHCVAD